MLNKTTSIDTALLTEEEQKQEYSPNPLQFKNVGDFGGSSSIFTTEEQNNINEIITSYQNTITHNALFEKLKNYESEFGRPSSEFYTKWKEGYIESNPKTSEWATIYRVIYGNN